MLHRWFQSGRNVSQRDCGGSLYHEHDHAVVEGRAQSGQGGPSRRQPQRWLPAATRGLWVHQAAGGEISAPIDEFFFMTILTIRKMYLNPQERRRLRERFPSLALSSQDAEACRVTLINYEGLALAREVCEGNCAMGRTCPTGMCRQPSKRFQSNFYFFLIKIIYLKWISSL